MLLQGTGSYVFLRKFLSSPSPLFYFNKNGITSHCSWKDHALDAYHPGATQIAVQHAVRHRELFSLYWQCVGRKRSGVSGRQLGDKRVTRHTHAEGHGADPGGPFHGERMTSSAQG